MSASHRTVITGDSASRSPLGRIVGNRYQLQAYVGPGQLGELFEAVDQQLTQAARNEHRVCLELFQLGEHQLDLRTSLANEFVNLLHLSHPNLARIGDFGIDGDAVFFTSELLAGKSLDAILNSNSTDAFVEKEILAIMKGIGDVLEYVHDKRVIHGDLRPASIFITEDFDIKLTDLPAVILRRAFSSIDIHRFGDSQALKPTTDVFGLAAIAYELLGNEPPYDGLPRGHARKKELKPQRIKGIPLQRWNTLSRALRLQPAKRTGSISQFIQEFGVTGTETLEDSIAAPTVKKRRWPKSLAWLAAIIMIAVVIQQFADELGAAFSRANEALFSQQAEPLNETAPAALPTASELGATEFPTQTAMMPPRQPDPAAASEENVDPSASDATIAQDAPTQVTAAGVNETASSVMPASSTPPDATTVAVQESDVSLQESSPTETVASPAGFSFRDTSLNVTEGQDMVAIELLRKGGSEIDAAAVWWTENGTALADRDYAESGVRTENFPAGVNSRTLYIPLIADSRAEAPETFFVHAGSVLEPKSEASRILITISDDDR